MDSAVQMANKLVDRLRAFQERQDAAREAWGALIAELERQAKAAGEVVQKALKQPESGRAGFAGRFAALHLRPKVAGTAGPTSLRVKMIKLADVLSAFSGLPLVGLAH